MDGFPPSLVRVIDAFSRFPGIGKKTAQRLGLHVLKSDVNSMTEFANSLIEVKEKISFCIECNNFAEAEKCEICENPKRDRHIICVVEESSDIFLFENTGFRGIYQVLGGVLSPLDGIGPDELKINDLEELIVSNSIEEIILASSPTVEGEATANYIATIAENNNIKATRIAYGVPVGGELEYVDANTLIQAMNNRNIMD